MLLQSPECPFSLQRMQVIIYSCHSGRSTATSQVCTQRLWQEAFNQTLLGCPPSPSSRHTLVANQACCGLGARFLAARFLRFNACAASSSSSSSSCSGHRAHRHLSRRLLHCWLHSWLMYLLPRA